MECGGVFVTLSLTLLSTMSTTEPLPERFSLPLAGQDTSNQPHDSTSSNPEIWQHNLLNGSDSKATFLDPLSSADAEELLKNDIRRQLYGPPGNNMGYQQYPNPGYQPIPNSGFQPVPNLGAQQFPNPWFQQSPGSSYPQIYKLDNLIIIANPTPAQPQPCIPQRPTPIDFPKPNKPDAGSTEDRIGGFDKDDKESGGDKKTGEPTKCTWAIVACCSPENNQVRYNCFELLGCPGFFFDGSPCSPEVVEAAAESTLNYYRSANRFGSSGKNN